MALVDSHCHLNFDSFEPDRAEVVARAAAEGVTRIVNPGIDLKSSREVVQLAERYPVVYAAVGVHPNDSLTWNDHTLRELRILAQQPKVVAIGEIGLDYYRDRAPRTVQQDVLRQQLNLAGELGLPVIIHTRNTSREDAQATQDTLDLLAEWQKDLAASHSGLRERPGVLHSFGGSLEHAKRALQMNFWIGVTGPVTFRNAPELQQIVASIPVDHLLVETDAPFLTPHPHRGQRNEPAYVRFVAEKIAQIHNLSFDTIADLTTSNAGRLFHWPVPD